MTRLSGLLAARPTAASAVHARFYATDTEQVYFSTGTEWVPKNSLADSDANGQISGANLAARPNAHNVIGYIWTDAETGNQYEAFPGPAWALINDLTPVAASATPKWTKYSVTLAQIQAAPVEDGMAKVLLLTTTGITVIHDAIIKPAAGFLGEVVDEVPAEVEVNVMVGKTGALEAILYPQQGYGAGAGIEDDPGYVQSALSPVADEKVAKNVAFFAEPTEINLYVELVTDPGPTVEADYDALTSGAVDLWLLQSTLPA